MIRKAIIVLHRKQPNMLDLQTTNLTSNKKSLSPTLDPQRRISTPQLNRVPSTTKKGMWMDEALEIAMDVVERGSHF